MHVSLKHLADPSMCRRFVGVAAAVMMLAFVSCSNKSSSKFPDNFSSLSTEKKMEFLMANMSPDSVAYYIIDAAMGKNNSARIELDPAIAYAYDNYKEDDMVAFTLAFSEYEKKIPLHEKVKFSKLYTTTEMDPEAYGYDVGLRYVGVIREEGLQPKQVKEELDRFAKACKIDPDFYKKFMKGFKYALKYDRGRDLDERIYTEFISYPDSIQ